MRETRKKILTVAVVISIFLLTLLSIYYLKKPQPVGHKQIFTEIFEKDAWHGGWGNKRESNIRYLEFLQYFIDTVPVKSIVDIGCGDWNLMQYIKIPKSIDYLGIDIVDKIIENNNKKYKAENIKFEANNSVDDLVKYKGDLLIVKDVFQLWSNSDILFAIRNIIPNFKYAIIVNNLWLYGSSPINSEIMVGDSRPLDLEAAPFFMKLKVMFDYDVPPVRMKRVYLYVRDEQPNLSNDWWKGVVNKLK